MSSGVPLMHLQQQTITFSFTKQTRLVLFFFAFVFHATQKSCKTHQSSVAGRASRLPPWAPAVEVTKGDSNKSALRHADIGILFSGWRARRPPPTSANKPVNGRNSFHDKFVMGFADLAADCRAATGCD